MEWFVYTSKSMSSQYDTIVFSLQIATHSNTTLLSRIHSVTMVHEVVIRVWDFSPHQVSQNYWYKSTWVINLKGCLEGKLLELSARTV